MAKPRIFVGSSTEAVGLARKLAAAMEADGLPTVVWDTNAFPVGSTLLDRIEAFADEFEGAILLFTPDVRSVRGAREFGEPVSNVMFEYGYLSARLTRPRVAVCLFEGADLPSDLQGVKVISAGTLYYKQLRDAVCDFAGDSRHANPWAADLYRRARARGHDHPHAVRILARAWVDIIWACWSTYAPYDPDRHGALQRVLNQDQPAAA